MGEEEVQVQKTIEVEVEEEEEEEEEEVGEVEARGSVEPDPKTKRVKGTTASSRMLSLQKISLFVQRAVLSTLLAYQIFVSIARLREDNETSLPASQCTFQNLCLSLH